MLADSGFTPENALIWVNVDGWGQIFDLEELSWN